MPQSVSVSVMYMIVCICFWRATQIRQEYPHTHGEGACWIYTPWHPFKHGNIPLHVELQSSYSQACSTVKLIHVPDFNLEPTHTCVL